MASKMLRPSVFAACASRFCDLEQHRALWRDDPRCRRFARIDRGTRERQGVNAMRIGQWTARGAVLALVGLLALVALAGAVGVQAQTASDLPGQGDLAKVPREVTLKGARFVFDRVINLDEGGLTRVGNVKSFRLYAPQGAAAPFDRLYGRFNPRPAFGLVRYLPEAPGGAPAACAAQVATVSSLNVGSDVYAFAGFEPDLTADQLQNVGTAGSETLLAEGYQAPFA